MAYVPIREFTNKLLEAVDENIIDPREALLSALNWMSESDVKKMCEANCFFEYEDDDAFDVAEAQEWADYDPAR